MGDAFRDTAGLAVLAAFAIGICAAMVEARRRGRRPRTCSVSSRRPTPNWSATPGQGVDRWRGAGPDVSGDARLPGPLPDRDRVGLQNAQRFREKRPEAAWAEVEEARSLTREALSEVRHLGACAQAAALEDRASPEAMAALARSFEGTGLDVRFAVEGSEGSPAQPSWSSTPLQEGLTNVLKHSSARRVAALLTFGAESVSLTVADDGEGVPEEAAEEGFGLATLGEGRRPWEAS